MTQTAPRFSRPLRRTTRRALVIMASSAVLFVLVLTQIAGPLAAVALWAGLAAWVAIAWRVDRSMHGLPERAEERLDERELAVRNATYHRAYRIITVLGILILTAGIAVIESAGRVGLAIEPRRGLLMLLVGYVTVVLSLPWMTLAWRLPDPIGDADG